MSEYEQATLRLCFDNQCLRSGYFSLWLRSSANESNRTTFISSAFDFRKRTLLFVNFRALLFSPCGKKSTSMKISMEHWWNDVNREEQKYLCQYTLSTTNPTTTGLRFNQGFIQERKPSTNRVIFLSDRLYSCAGGMSRITPNVLHAAGAMLHFKHA